MNMISTNDKKRTATLTQRRTTPRSRRASLVSFAVVLSVGGGCQVWMEDSSAEHDALGGESQQLRVAPDRLRDYIARAVGGLDKLTVPADDASIPLPAEDPERPGRYATTEAKRYLGKMLFHDPVRTARINVNTAVPLDLPEGTAFGGTVENTNVDAVVAAQR